MFAIEYERGNKMANILGVDDGSISRAAEIAGTAA